MSDVSGGAAPFEVEQMLEHGPVRAEVLAYRRLQGAGRPAAAAALHQAQEAGAVLRQVRLTLRDSEVTVEGGTLHFLRGAVEMETDLSTMGDMLRKAASKMLSKEALFKPRYRGSGEIYLEPSFAHFLLLELDGEEVIVDKGMFLACDSSIKVSVVMQRSLSSGVLSSEGWFQTHLKGHGLCVLASPVAEPEILRVTLQNESLQVDGRFALLRKGRIHFSVEQSAKTLFGTLTSGEGLLQTFRGSGEVWIAPTKPVYERLEREGLGMVAQLLKSVPNPVSRLKGK